MQAQPATTPSEPTPNASVVPSKSIRLSGVMARIGAAKAASATDPQVEVVRENGVITAIDVTCSCGKKIRVHCQY